MRNMTQAQLYLDGLQGIEPAIIQESRDLARQWNLEKISLGMNEAKILFGVVKLHGAIRFIEVGTLAGTSCLYLQMAIGKKSGAMVYSFEKDPQRAELAQKILDKGFREFGCPAQVIQGDAEISLASVEKLGPFDGIFIDGNKSAYLRYLDWAEKNVRKGGLIIADNVFLGGGVWGQESSQFSEKQIQTMRKFNQRLANGETFQSFFLPTSEGLSVSVKKI